MTPKTKDALDKIVDIFACTDGGVSYSIIYHRIIPFLEENDNPKAKEIILRIQEFGDLMTKMEEFANKILKESK